MNTVILMGRLTGNPELKHTSNDVAVTSFSLAVDRPHTKGEKQTDFLNVVAWRSTAEFICRYFRKGQLIALEGSLQSRSYTDKEGSKRTAVEILAEKVHFTGDKRTEDKADPPADVSADVPADDFEDIPDDDYPF